MDKWPLTEAGQVVRDIVIKNRIEKKSLNKIEQRRSEREEIPAESTLQMDNAFCWTASSWRAERTDKPAKDEQPYSRSGRM